MGVYTSDTPLAEILIVCSCLGYVVPQFVTFVHELGHALAVVRYGSGRPTIRIGHDAALVRFSVGRIDVRWHPTGIRARCEHYGQDLSPRDLRRVAMAGPLASVAGGLAAAVLSVVVGPVTEHDAGTWILRFAAFAFLLDVLNALPIRQRRGAGEYDYSDGWIAREVTREFRQGGRWNLPLTQHVGMQLPPLTDETALIVLSAERLAARMGSGCFGSQHVSAAVLASGEIDTALRQAGADLEVLRSALPASPPPGEDVTMEDRLPPGPTVVRMLDRASRYLGSAEAIEPSHLALTALDAWDETSALALLRSGADAAALRRALQPDATPVGQAA